MPENKINRYLITNIIIICIIFNYTSKASEDTLKTKEKETFFAGSKRYTILGDNPPTETNIKPIPLAITAGAVTGVFIAQHYLQLNTIWKEQSDFHIVEDGRYALYADKAGHFFGTYFTAYLMSESLMLSGFSYETSNIIGTCIGLGYTTYVEILDGYGKNWGFCPSDFYADIAGAAFHFSQIYVPFMQNFTPKFTYIPANWHGELKRKPSDMFIDDYSSHTLWLSVNVYNLLPEEMKKYWVPWLQISFGYAARNLCNPLDQTLNCDPNRSKQIYNDVWGNPKFIISLDYNLIELLPDGPGFWNWFKQTLNNFKLPSPAIEFGDVTKFYLLYPFSINLNNIRF